LKRKCDKCGRNATHHSVEVHKGQKVEKHLCDACAAEEGEGVKGASTPINELLSNFVKLHAGSESQGQTAAGSSGRGRSRSEITCDECGLAFSEFRETGLLGCPHCYKAFEDHLASLIERAQEGATHHLGKVPNRAGAGEARQVQLTRMRKRLDDAVACEDYELAAQLRDDIRQLEEPE
jgi:protein arginine kinase activator